MVPARSFGAQDNNILEIVQNTRISVMSSAGEEKHVRMHILIKNTLKVVNSITAGTSLTCYSRTSIADVHAVHAALYAESMVKHKLDSDALETPRLVSVIEEIAALLEILMVQLHRFGSHLGSADLGSISNAKDRLFWELWTLLLSIFHSLQSVTGPGGMPAVWDQRYRPAFLSLYHAFHSLMVWMISISRSQAWLAMTIQHGLLQRRNDVLFLILHSSNWLTHIFSAPPSLLTISLGLVLDTYLPLLCTLAVETYHHIPALVKPYPPLGHVQATAYPQHLSLYHLAKIFPHQIQDQVKNILACFLTRDRMNPPYTHDVAVLHFVKVYLVSTAPVLIQDNFKMIGWLYDLLRESLSTPTPELSQAARECNSNLLGLPLFLNPLVSSHILDIDLQLLHMLGTFIDNEDHGRTIRIYVLQSIIIGCWILSGRQLVATTDQVSEMVKCVAVLAKECSKKVLLMMNVTKTNCVSQQQDLVQHDDSIGVLQNLFTLCTLFNISPLHHRQPFTSE